MIPFLDLKAQYRETKDEIARAVAGVLESGNFVLGEHVAAFEDEFASYSGASHGIAVNSGTSALHLALLSLDVGPDDEVITVPFTFVATVAAIGYTGAKTVFVDIDPRTFTMDANLLERAISPRTKAIIPVHLYGQSADMDAIKDIAWRNGVAIIEDACQAHGAEYKGRRVGAVGTMGCFSFYPGKNLGACGEGGLVTTNSPEHARTIRMLRDWGQERKYQHIRKGYNYRMEALQGAILRVKLRYLEKWTEARRQHAGRYHRLLADTGNHVPEAMTWARHVYHIYAIRSSQRDSLQRYLNDNDIQTGIHYPIPVHLQKGYTDLGYAKGDFPHAERAAEEVLSLPMYAELHDAAIDQVADAVRAFRPIKQAA